jgi:hypothetical protein
MHVRSDFTLFVRIYAPFKTFGFGFEGDDRGPTTAACVSSRIAASVTFDPVAGLVRGSDVRSSPSRFVPAGLTATARPRQRISAVKLARGLLLQLDIAGANPLAPPAPDIDVRLRLEAAVSDSRLDVVAGLTGDAFPNAEVFLEDGARSRRMVITFATSGGRQTGPLIKLPGNRQENMSGICRCFGLTPDGFFAESQQGRNAA